MELDNYTGKYTGAGQTIVIIDQGISTSYTNSNVVYSYDFADNDNDAINSGGNHGGQVANVAQNVASGVKIIHLKVFSDGSSGAYNSDIEEALQWVVANTDAYSITAVNLSLGLGNVQTPTTWLGSDEYQALDDKGVIVTVASGNSKASYSCDGVNLLASSESVISVSATNADGEFTSFSQQHKDLTDVAALGENINVIDNNGIAHSISGTSFSAPTIAGSAAVLQEAAIDLLGHKLTDEEFLDLIQKTGDKVGGYTINEGATTATTDTTTTDTTLFNKDTLVQTPEPETHVPTPDSDGTIATANKLGTLSNGAKLLQDSVTKETDDKDFFQFELSANGKVDFLLSNLSSDVDLNLYDSSGKSLHHGWEWGSVDVGYQKTLDAGTYYVGVDYYDGYNKGVTSTYDLSLTLSYVSPVPTPNLDGTIATANKLGTLSNGAKLLQDSVTKETDDKDFFQFELSANGKVDFLLSNLSSDVDLNLYDSSGKSLHNGWEWGSVDIGYQKTLDAGTYYVGVDYYDGYNKGFTSTYDLTLTLSDVVSPNPTPSSPVGYTKINLANAVTYLETHQNEYNDQIVLEA
uniref:S8 family serine peptidase n=1 Tax=Candidatus Thiodubiliella endoseptemdiera TaxID=2738886 RepID=UPI0034DF8743